MAKAIEYEYVFDILTVQLHNGEVNHNRKVALELEKPFKVFRHKKTFKGVDYICELGFKNCWAFKIVRLAWINGKNYELGISLY